MFTLFNHQVAKITQVFHKISHSKLFQGVEIHNQLIWYKVISSFRLEYNFYDKLRFWLFEWPLFEFWSDYEYNLFLFFRQTSFFVKKNQKSVNKSKYFSAQYNPNHPTNTLVSYPLKFVKLNSLNIPANSSSNHQTNSKIVLTLIISEFRQISHCLNNSS